jgi:ABC-type glycerol-3-phosphate transport system permease component
MKKKTVKKILTHVAVWLVVIIVDFPIYWMFTTSVTPEINVSKLLVTYFPTTVSLENYKVVLTTYSFGTFLRNSLIVATCTTIFCVILAALAAYSLVRFSFLGKRFFNLLFLSTQMIPALLFIVPLFLIFRTLHLVNRLPSLIIAYTTFSLPFCMWMLRGYFKTISTELIDAAKVDGCSELQILSRVIVPLAAPGLVAVATVSFLLGWSEFLFALILCSAPAVRTLSVGLAQFLTRFIYWSHVMAAATIYTIPVIILFAFFQKYVVAGLSAGAVKE